MPGLFGDRASILMNANAIEAVVPAGGITYSNLPDGWPATFSIYHC
jgi:hypothetical protein